MLQYLDFTIKLGWNNHLQINVYFLSGNFKNPREIYSLFSFGGPSSKSKYGLAMFLLVSLQ